MKAELLITYNQNLDDVKMPKLINNGKIEICKSTKKSFRSDSVLKIEKKIFVEFEKKFNLDDSFSNFKNLDLKTKLIVVFESQNHVISEKTASRIINDNAASIPKLNILGKYIYDDLWIEISSHNIMDKINDTINKENQNSKLKEDKTTKPANTTIQKYLYLSVFFAIGAAVLYFTFSKNKNLQTNKKIKNKEPVSANISYSEPPFRFINGIIVNSKNQPIENVYTIIENHKTKYFSNQDGWFQITDIELSKFIRNDSAINILLYHPEYDSLFYTINKNIFLKNKDTLSKITLRKAPEKTPKSGNTYNFINEIKSEKGSQTIIGTYNSN